MEILYKNELLDVCWERISELIEGVGWPQRPPEDLKQAFEKSTFIRIAYHHTHIYIFRLLEG